MEGMQCGTEGRLVPTRMAAENLVAGGAYIPPGAPRDEPL